MNGTGNLAGNARPSGQTCLNQVQQSVAVARAAQPGWARTPIKQRLRVLHRFRAFAAEHAVELTELSAQGRGRPAAESMTAELVPLLEAVRFLERDSARILAPRKLGLRGRPAWLPGVTSEVQRVPLGVVLVIGPSNYPLFLPGVQMLQALAAGNAVMVKPGAGGSAVMRTLAELLHHSGLDHRLIQVLPELPTAASVAIECGVDKVVLTGSAATGQRVLAQLARHGVPAVMELSGCDAAFVCDDADLGLVVRALRFGILLNNGATCIAPRRVFVHRAVATELEGRLAVAFDELNNVSVPTPLKEEWMGVIREALAEGAHLVSGSLNQSGNYRPPLILAGVSPAMRLPQSDIFAPVMSLMTVGDDHEAIELSKSCPYALGATVFSRDVRRAQSLARHIHAGGVVINDMIVPTADPRLPFGGRGRSGFGATRGSEGLLEMTVPKVIATQRLKWQAHLEPPQIGDEDIFRCYLRATHAAELPVRLKAGFDLMRHILRRIRAGRRHAKPRHSNQSTLNQYKGSL